MVLLNDVDGDTLLRPVDVCRVKNTRTYAGKQKCTRRQV